MGPLAALGAALCWSIASLLYERHGKAVGGPGLNLIKCVLSFALMLPTQLAASGSLRFATLDGSQLPMLAVSGLVGLAIGDTLWFACMLRIGATRALLLYTVAPLFTGLLGWVVLGESLSPWALIGMVVTLAGVAWVIGGRSADGSADGPIDWAGVLAGLGSAACQAIGTSLTKLAAPGGDALEVSIVRLGAGSIGLVILLGAAGRLGSVAPMFRDPAAARGILVASFLGTYLGVWFMNAGFLLTAVGVASTLNATTPIFVLIAAWAMYREQPPLRSVIGAAIAVGGVALLFLT